MQSSEELNSQKQVANREEKKGAKEKIIKRKNFKLKTGIKNSQHKKIKLFLTISIQLKSVINSLIASYAFLLMVLQTKYVFFSILFI